MKNIIKKFAQGLLLVPAMALAFGFVAPVAMVGAQAGDAGCNPDTPTLKNGVGCAQGTDQPADLFGDGGIFQTIVNILLFIVGIIAVIMLIIGGIRYVVSGGDQTAVTAAKNTILYAIIGIIVAILAYAAVQFVVNGILDNTT